MLRLALAAVLASAAFAQTASDAPKPPAEVDEALRARIAEFYQFHVNGEYRKAEKLVAEESQDFYYERNKPKYLGFEIQTITYQEDFTKAKATVLCEQYLTGVGLAGRRMKMPSLSSWKLVDGKWFWYVSPEELSRGPLGLPAKADGKAEPGAKPPAEIPTSAGFVFGKLKWEKDELTVKPNETYTLTITNGSPGTAMLSFAQVLPGIKTTIDKATLNPGEKAVVTFKTDENPHSGTIACRIDPLGEIIAIQVKRQAP